jgi:dTDP-4-dehydrorhamnose reductase
MVGWELNRSLLPLGEVIALGRAEADLSRPESLRQIVRDIQPDVIVNAAAYTAVDKAEEEEQLATVINGEAPGVLAEEAKRCGALLVHYSTDYVFDGTKDSPYVETDTPNPINAYGRSKLTGEQAIQASGADYLIFRTSWVYAARGRNFLLTMLRLMQEREELKVVADQIGAPTWARTIADTTAHCIRQAVNEVKRGHFTPNTYHLTNSGETSWHGFAEIIAEYAKQTILNDELRTKRIEKINTKDYSVSARRPINSRLSLESLPKDFSLVMVQWNRAVMLCMDELVQINTTIEKYKQRDL